MSQRQDDTDLDGLREEARAWVVRLYSGEVSTADTAELMSWRARSDDHARVLGETVRLRRLMVQAGHNLRAASPREESAVPVRILAPAGRAPVARRAFIGGAIAASVGGFLIARPPMGLWPSFAELQSDYRTGTGERRTIALARGVAVDLNTRTSVVLRSDARQDGLELITGEVAVDADSPIKPVVIRTSAGMTVSQTGRFGVRLEDDKTCVTCLTGRVAITTVDDRKAELKPGQQLKFDKGALGPVIGVDTVRAEAWRHGLLIFVDEPLTHVVDELNRYRHGKVILTNANLRDIPINAVFQLNRLDGAVTQLREVAKAQSTSLPGGVVLLS